MAKRYIDADKLIDELNYNTALTWARGLGSAWWSHAVNLKDNMLKCIDRMPTADVVEVVRCKDCKHATFYACKNDACYRGIICEYQIGTDDENFFCSYGERRTDDGNL